MENKIKVENKDMEESSGFWAGWSSMGHFFTIKILSEKRSPIRLQTHLAFNDLENAYDSNLISELWKTMTRKGINKTLLEATKRFL